VTLIFFKNLNPPVSNQKNRVWAGGKKAEVKISVRSLRIIWWSRLACFSGKGRRLHFVDDSAKVDSAYYTKYT